MTCIFYPYRLYDSGFAPSVLSLRLNYILDLPNQLRAGLIVTGQGRIQRGASGAEAPSRLKNGALAAEGGGGFRFERICRRLQIISNTHILTHLECIVTP